MLTWVNSLTDKTAEPIDALLANATRIDQTLVNVMALVIAVVIETIKPAWARVLQQRKNNKVKFGIKAISDIGTGFNSRATNRKLQTLCI